MDLCHTIQPAPTETALRLRPSQNLSPGSRTTTAPEAQAAVGRQLARVCVVEALRVMVVTATSLCFLEPNGHP